MLPPIAAKQVEHMHSCMLWKGVHVSSMWRKMCQQHACVVYRNRFVVPVIRRQQILKQCCQPVDSCNCSLQRNITKRKRKCIQAMSMQGYRGIYVSSMYGETGQHTHPCSSMCGVAGYIRPLDVRETKTKCSMHIGSPHVWAICASMSPACIRRHDSEVMTSSNVQPIFKVCQTHGPPQAVACHLHPYM